MEAFLLKAAASFSDRKPQLVFLINNQDDILCILNVKSLILSALVDMALIVHPFNPSKECESSTIDQEREVWTSQLTSNVTEFLEEELRPFFGALMQLVKMAEGNSDVQSLNQSNTIFHFSLTPWTEFPCSRFLSLSFTSPFSFLFGRGPGKDFGGL